MRSSAIIASLALVLGACDGDADVSGDQARVRNQPPSICTTDNFNACPAPEVQACPDGTEPVIDYSSDCCPHFSCQPVCVPSDPDAECHVGPAPLCPPGTQLWIGTAIEDCCPAYRCEPIEQCDPTREDAPPCPPSMPYCGDGVEPIVVGQTPDCCPIFQCPCDPDMPATDPTCGCTYPMCGPGEQLVCMGDNICGYPCECQPVTGECMNDGECPPDMFCDLSYCLPPPGCDPSSGEACPDVCYGMCQRTVVDGCRGDLDCPAGQRCEVACTGWGCVPGPDGTPCADCTAPDANCVCEPDGSCHGEGDCIGWCVPAVDCSSMPPVECAPPPPMPCPDPVEVGLDPATCCPIYECPTCRPTGAPCAMPGCPDAIQIGTDPSCCPVFCCPSIPGSCPPPPMPAPTPEPAP